jgi:hypothetical protein
VAVQSHCLLRVDLLFVQLGEQLLVKKRCLLLGSQRSSLDCLPYEGYSIFELALYFVFKVRDHVANGIALDNEVPSLLKVSYS